MIELDNHGDILIVRPTGRLDSANSPELETTLNTQFDAGKNKLVFDLGSLEYISSAGLRVVLVAGKRLRSSGGKLVLVGLHGMILEVFQMSGFLSLFQVAPSLEDGLNMIK